MARTFFATLIVLVIACDALAQPTAKSREAASVASIIDGLKNVSDGVRGVFVSSSAEVEFYSPFPRKWPNSAIKAEWCFQGDVARVEASVDQKKKLPDGNSMEHSSLIACVFDASRARGIWKRISIQDNGLFKEEKFQAIQLILPHSSPSAFLTEIVPPRVSQFLIENEFQLVGQEMWKGRTVAVLESPKPADDVQLSQQQYIQLLFDETAKCTVSQRTYKRSKLGEPWYLQQRWDCLESVRIEGLEMSLPKQIHTWEWAISKNGTRRCGREEHIVFDNWKVMPDANRRLISADEPLTFEHFKLNDSSPPVSP